ncbi:MAG TPA: PEP-CTERM sorting domain-containing protein [Bryobacteraceae bacterium]|nr:PEP-CTERM sorting domain-containing protein [Bryobacteraceae bacterium]
MSSRIVVLFMMLFLGCGLLSADTITVTGVDNTRGVTSLLWIDEHGTPTNVYYAGVINLLLNQTFQRDSLCAQLFVDIGLSTYNTTVMTPYAAEAEFGRNLEQAAWLVHKELPLVTTADEGAGLQLAIWDIVEDGGDGLTQGNVKASTDPSNPTDPTILGLAEAYEKESVGEGSNLAFVYVNTSFGGVPAQMLIGPEFGSGPVPTPEPSTLGLGGLGLVAASLLLRKKFGYRSRKADPAS